MLSQSVVEDAYVASECSDARVLHRPAAAVISSLLESNTTYFSTERHRVVTPTPDDYGFTHTKAPRLLKSVSLLTSHSIRGRADFEDPIPLEPPPPKRPVNLPDSV